MKIRTLSVVIVFLLTGIGLYAQQPSGDNLEPGYLTVSAIYAAPNWDNVKAGYGIGLAFGGEARKHHIVELEAMLLSFNMDDYNDGGTTLSEKYKVLPILVTYCYSIPAGTSAEGLSFHLGASAGMTMMKATIRAFGASLSDNDWVTSIGAQAGLVKRLGTNASFTASLRGLWTNKAEFKFRGQRASEDSAVMLMGTIGLSFRL